VCRKLLGLLSCLLLLTVAGQVSAHHIPAGDQGYLQEISGVHWAAFMYLGAKHMVTSYDHLLFLAGMLFFFYRLKDIALCVSLFAISHSAAMFLGVWLNSGINDYLMEISLALVVLSILYKALDNLHLFSRWFGITPDVRLAAVVFGIATFVFALCHGLELSSKVNAISADGFLTNLLAFNLGVELGQLLALAVMGIMAGYLRRALRLSGWFAKPPVNLPLSLNKQA